MQRKGILEFMKNCLRHPNYNNKICGRKNLTSLIQTLFDQFYVHYGIRDIEEQNKCKHQLRFSLLYLEESEKNFTQIADETLADVSNDTFKYHIRKYNQTMFEYIKEESHLNLDYALILSEYLKSIT